MTFRSLPNGFVILLALSVGACSDDGADPSDMPEDTSEQPATGDLGKGDGSDVIAIGDSWMNLMATSGIQFSLKTASGQNYRSYGVPGTCLMAGHCLLPGDLIPSQYTAAKAENPNIKTVVMTGGGNDILQDLNLGLLGGCSDANIDVTPGCKARIDEISGRLKELWAEMAMDGVRDVVVVGYSRKAMLGGPLIRSVVYSGEKIQPICDSVPSPLRCHTMDSDMVVPDIALRSDNIHPDDPSYEKLGKAVFALMEEKGMRR